MVHLLGEFDGRIRRKHFWLGLFTIIIVGSLAIIGLTDRYTTEMINLIVMGLLIYPCSALFAKRLHDRNKSAVFWLFIFFAPYVALVVMQGFSIGFTEITLFDQKMLMPTNYLGYGVSAFASTVGFWALVDLGLLEGTVGANDYGEDPKSI